MTLRIKTKNGNMHKVILAKKQSVNTSLNQKQQRLIKDLIEEQTKIILKRTLNINRLIFLRRVQYYIVFSIDSIGEKVISKFVFKNGKQPGYIYLDALEVTAAGLELAEFVTQMESYGVKAGGDDPRALLEIV